MTGLEAIKKKLKTDPSYSKEDAVAEWMKLNPEGAVAVAQEMWPASDDPNGMLTSDQQYDEIHGMDPWDAFVAGYGSAKDHPYDFDPYDQYFEKDGSGHYESISYDAYVKGCQKFGRDYSRYIIEDSKYYDLPDEFEQLLAFECSKNLRPRSGSKTRAKSPARKQPSKSSNAKSRNAKSPNTKSRNAKRASGSRR